MRKFILALIIVCGLCSQVSATIYYQNTMEAYTGDAVLANPPFCNTDCGYRSCPGYARSGSAPQGSKYIEFPMTLNMPSMTTCSGYPSPCDCLYEIGTNQQNMPITSLPGKTIYLAYLKRFERVGGVDIWHDGPGETSGDKGIEIRGDYFRWIVSRGNGWAGGAVSDHHWTVWLGNPTYHLNDYNAYCPNLEIYDSIPLNTNGYGTDNPIVLDYEKWYSIVVKAIINTMSGSNPNADGTIELWVNGVKVASYTNMCWIANSAATITMIEAGGTIAQGAYDAPAHKRQFDAFILTDTLTDIDGTGGTFNYFADPEGADPAPTVTDASVNGSTVTVNFSETVVTTGYDDSPADFNLDCTSPTLTDVALTSPSGSGTTWTFTSASTIVAGQDCTLDYIGSTNDIEDAAGNDLAAFSDTSVTNNTADVTPPTVSSSAVNGTSVTINFDKIVVTTGYDDSPCDFNIDCSGVGHTDVCLTGPTGTGSTRTFTAASAITHGETCNLDYTGGANDVEDVAGNDLVVFSDTAVANNTPGAITGAPMDFGGKVTGGKLQ